MADCFLFKSGSSDAPSHISNGLIYSAKPSVYTEEFVESTILNLTIPDIVTYEVCFKPTQMLDSSAKGRIWEIGYSSNSDIFFGISLNNTNVEFCIYQYSATSWGIVDSTSKIQCPLNETHTITCVVDSNGIMLYRDSVLMSTFAKQYVWSQSNNKIHMNYKTASTRTDRSSYGVINAARIYNRALSAEEVLGNYKVDKALYGD